MSDVVAYLGLAVAFAVVVLIIVTVVVAMVSSPAPPPPARRPASGPAVEVVFGPEPTSAAPARDAGPR